jgi:hypothetical protein
MDLLTPLLFLFLRERSDDGACGGSREPLVAVGMSAVGGRGGAVAQARARGSGNLPYYRGFYFFALLYFGSTL